jgi:uncharacterized membrane protein YdbT with pleckstrin-like domain
MLRRTNPVASVFEQIFGVTACQSETDGLPRSSALPDEIAHGAIKARAIERRLGRELEKLRVELVGNQKRLDQAEAACDAEQAAAERADRCQLVDRLQDLEDRRAIAASLAASLKQQVLMSELHRTRASCR